MANAVPVCARFCLQKFIAESFPVSICSSQQNLECLCTRKSTSGYTLGEGALRCVALACLNETVRDAAAYGICSGIRNALPNTHGTITATVVPATRATTASMDSGLFDLGSQTTSSLPAASIFPSSILPFSGDLTVSGLVTATGSPSPLSLPTSASSVTPGISGPSQTTQAAATTSNVTPVKTGALTTPQIAGIAVAGVGSAAVAFGIMLFIYCIRRRRALKEQSEQLPFEIEKAPPKADQNPPGPPPPPPKDVQSENKDVGSPKPIVKEGPKVPPKDNAKRRSFWRRTIKPDDIGVAVSPETTQQASPKSVASYRTTSKLLPDKPAYTLWPRALPVTQRDRPESAATNFEEDLERNRRSALNMPTYACTGHVFMETHQWPVQQRHTQHPYYSQAYPVDSRALMYAKEKANHTRRPSLPTNIRPDSKPTLEDPWTAPKHNLQRPSTLRHPTSLTPGPYHPRNTSCVASAAPTARSSNYSTNQSMASTNQQMHQPLQTYHPASQQSTSTRQSRRYSNASDTSFEDAGDDDESPFTEPTLSPVAESPQRSPISALKYPNIPRSASMAKKVGVYQPGLDRRQSSKDGLGRERSDRAPYQAPRKRDGSPSSLLAKRRGDKAAAELEKALKIRQNDNAAPPSKTTWKVVNTPGIENAEQGFKSPIWEPKLTPTMRGGDLYLEVQ